MFEHSSLHSTRCLIQHKMGVDIDDGTSLDEGLAPARFKGLDNPIPRRWGSRSISWLAVCGQCQHPRICTHLSPSLCEAVASNLVLAWPPMKLQQLPPGQRCLHSISDIAFSAAPRYLRGREAYGLAFLLRCREGRSISDEHWGLHARSRQHRVPSGLMRMAH